ncbi:MAG: hypothetical protein ACTHMC_01565 [Pseudobacter sp.]|uniref:hypothetical protein n=1 Tax=Pseudobacter sp. TaxID=2045420 RepID=UPI003F7D17AE
MPGEDRIDSIIDIPAVKAEYDQLIKMLESLGFAIKSAGNGEALKNPSIPIKELRTESEKSAKTVHVLAENIVDVVKADEKLIAVTKMTLAAQAEQIRENKVLSGSYDQLIRQLTKNNMWLSSMNEKKAELKKSYDEGRISLEDYTDSMSKVEKEIGSVKFANGELNRSLKNLTKEGLNAEGSLNQMRGQLSQALQAWDALADVDRNSEIGAGMLRNIQVLTNEIKKLEESTGRFGRNVGNYTNALGILKKELGDVANKIQDMNSAGDANQDVLQALVKEHDLLQKLVDSQANGFASLNEELAANEKALMKLKNEGKENTVMYEQLFAEIAKAKSELSSFKKEMATRGSGELVLEAGIQAAQTLASIYGIAEGASALFGKQSEALEKTMVKLQAVIAILNGLEALNNVIKKEGALRTALNVGLQKIATIQTNLQTAAESRSIVVKWAAVAAQKALNLVMSAAGGPMLAIVGILALLVLGFKSFAAEANNTKVSIDQLNASLDNSLSVSDDLVKELKRASNERVAQLQADFKSEAEVRKEQIRLQRIQSDELFEIERAYKQQVAQQKMELRSILKKSESDMTDDEKERVKKMDEFVKKYQEIQDKRKEIDSQLRVSILGDQKATTEESVKARQEDLDSTKEYLQVKANIYNEIISNERKSYSDRVKAANDFLKVQESLIKKEADKQLMVKGLTPSQIKLIESQRSAALQQARLDSQRKIEELNRQERDRIKAARFEIIKIEIEAQARANDLIAEQETNGYEKRLDAAFAAYEKRRELIAAQREYELSQENLLQSEREAIIKRHADSINQLTEQYVKTQTDIYKAGEQKAEESLQRSYQRRLDIIARGLAMELTAIEDIRARGKMGVADYELAKLGIERKYRMQSYQEENKRLVDQVLKTKEGTAERAAAERELAEHIQQMHEESNQTIEKLDSAKWERMAEKVSNYGQLVGGVLSTISDLSSINFDKELARIEELQAANEKLKAVELDRIEKSTLSEQDKAAKIAILNAKSQMQQEEIERKKRRIEVERARFEKATNISNIITTTALAVMRTLADHSITPGWVRFALAATAGATGAAQLARAIAAPLPKFAKGTDSSPEGPAIVGEEGAEMFITPSGKVGFTPSKATLTWLEKGTKIIPHDEINHAMNARIMKQMAYSMTSDNTNNKKIEEVRDAIVWLAGELGRGQKKAKVPNVILQDMSGWKAHIKKNVFD